LPYRRVISKEEGETFAARSGLLFMECSARKCVNVERAFKTISEKVLEKIDSGEINAYEEVLISNLVGLG
jgi:GTPase SAR1 family protein